MTISIDFDGTIVDHEFPDIGPLLPGALKTIRKLQDNGHKIIMWTCRDGEYLVKAVEFMADHDISFDAINQNPLGFPDHFAQKKIYADVYIDDRNLGGFPGWDAVAKHFNV